MSQLLRTGAVTPVYIRAMIRSLAVMLSILSRTHTHRKTIVLIVLTRINNAP